MGSGLWPAPLGDLAEVLWRLIANADVGLTEAFEQGSPLSALFDGEPYGVRCCVN